MRDVAEIYKYMSPRGRKIYADAVKAFSKHELRSTAPDRWLIQERHKDGGWDWTFAAEAVSLRNGSLYVGGDIDFVIFGHYGDSPDHERKLRWMGCGCDIEYYVAQKASIGTGSALVHVYDEGTARETIKSWIDDLVADRDDYDDSAKEDALREILANFPESQHDLMVVLHERMGSDFMCDRYNVGEAIDGRVYYAHAATRRICELLDAEAARESA